MDEVIALKPKLIVSVGEKALNALFHTRGRIKLKQAFESQVGGFYDTLDLQGYRCEVSLVPRPSGLSRFWNNPPENAPKILNDIVEKIENTLKTTKLKD